MDQMTSYTSDAGKPQEQTMEQLTHGNELDQVGTSPKVIVNQSLGNTKQTDTMEMKKTTGAAAKKAAKKATNANGKSKPKITLAEIDHPIYRLHGQPFYVDNKRVALNHKALAHKFVAQVDVCFNNGSNVFRAYDQQTGAWRELMENEVKASLAEFVAEEAEQCKCPTVAYRTNAAVLNSLASMVKVVAGITEEPPEAQHGLILVSNGVLDLTGDKPALKSFDRDYQFTANRGIPYDPEAECPRFLKELLGTALNKEDIALIQQYFGSILLGPNLSHRILILKGTPGGGKSTLVNVLERVIGVDRVAYLRPPHLSGRFEFSGFLGKRLLTGKDVPGDSLSLAGAKLLKSLVGGDRLEGEIKYDPNKHALMGDFHVVIASNSSLRIGLEGDVDAWRRRLLLVNYERPKTDNPIPNFAEALLQQEAAGILAWLVEGAMKHKHEARQFSLTDAQQARIDDLLHESESAEFFVRNQVVPAEKDQAATVAELLSAYLGFCQQRKWTSLSERQFENCLAGLMSAHFGVIKRNDIRRGDHVVRGYSGVMLKVN